MTGVEWGAGASSFWLLQRLHKLISVEHDQSFFTSLHKHAHMTWPVELFAHKWLFLHVSYDETIDSIGGDPTITSILPYTYHDPYPYAADIEPAVMIPTASFGYGIPYVDAPWKKPSSSLDDSSNNNNTNNTTAAASSASFIPPHHDQPFQPLPFDPHELLDFIFIDGKARGACLARAVLSIQPHGGILVLDNRCVFILSL